jgi:hypothetical protein
LTVNGACVLVDDQVKTELFEVSANTVIILSIGVGIVFGFEAKLLLHNGKPFFRVGFDLFVAQRDKVGVAIGVESDLSVLGALSDLLPGHEITVVAYRALNIDKKGEGVVILLEKRKTVFIKAFEAVIDGQDDPSVADHFIFFQGVMEAFKCDDFVIVLFQILEFGAKCFDRGVCGGVPVIAETVKNKKVGIGPEIEG